MKLESTLKDHAGFLYTAPLLDVVLLLLVFFLLTTSQYQFFKLLNVGIFTVAGSMGVLFLAQGMRIVAGVGTAGESNRRWVLRKSIRPKVSWSDIPKRS